jgi:hypothetical protein
LQKRRNAFGSRFVAPRTRRMPGSINSIDSESGFRVESHKGDDVGII